MIRDIVITPQFIADWDKARSDPQVYKYVDRLIKNVSRTGTLPNSLNAHRAYDGLDIMVGYVSANKVGWRMTYSIDEEDHMIFDRLLKHEQMDTYLKEII